VPALWVAPLRKKLAEAMYSDEYSETLLQSDDSDVKQMCRRTVLAVFAALLPVLAGPAQARDLLVFAAASLKDAADDIGKAYQAAGGGKVTYSFATTSSLAKQIEGGAPAAVFISADSKWMDYLAERNLIVGDSRRDLLSNRLVLIAPSDSPLAIKLAAGAPLAQALGDGKLALADPDGVPAGRYGKAALESLKLWSSVEPSVVRAQDVRAALAFVERGEASAGIVYATDALISKRVRIVDEFPQSSHPKIVYPIALVAGQDDGAARAFYDFLAGPKARGIFLDYGFSVIGTSAATN
jgi:molybdate transport system substrate-binding protein